MLAGNTQGGRQLEFSQLHKRVQSGLKGASKARRRWLFAYDRVKYIRRKQIRALSEMYGIKHGGGRVLQKFFGKLMQFLVRARSRILSKKLKKEVGNDEGVYGSVFLGISTKVSYINQADPAMLEAAMLEKRAKLRTHPELKQVIKDIWEKVPKCPRPYGTSIDKQIYLYVAARWVDEFLETDEERRLAIMKTGQDWQKESNGEYFMPYDTFFDSVFELLDVWIPTVDIDDYTSLAAKILDKTKKSARMFVYSYPLAQRHWSEYVAASELNSKKDEDNGTGVLHSADTRSVLRSKQSGKKPNFASAFPFSDSMTGGRQEETTSFAKKRGSVHSLHHIKTEKASSPLATSETPTAEREGTHRADSGPGLRGGGASGHLHNTDSDASEMASSRWGHAVVARRYTVGFEKANKRLDTFRSIASKNEAKHGTTLKPHGSIYGAILQEMESSLRDVCEDTEDEDSTPGTPDLSHVLAVFSPKRANGVKLPDNATPSTTELAPPDAVKQTLTFLSPAARLCAKWRKKNSQTQEADMLAEMSLSAVAITPLVMTREEYKQEMLVDEVKYAARPKLHTAMSVARAAFKKRIERDRLLYGTLGDQGEDYPPWSIDAVLPEDPLAPLLGPDGRTLAGIRALIVNELELTSRDVHHLCTFLMKEAVLSLQIVDLSHNEFVAADAVVPLLRLLSHVPSIVCVCVDGTALQRCAQMRSVLLATAVNTARVIKYATHTSAIMDHLKASCDAGGMIRRQPSLLIPLLSVLADDSSLTQGSFSALYHDVCVSALCRCGVRKLQALERCTETPSQGYPLVPVEDVVEEFVLAGGEVDVDIGVLDAALATVGALFMKQYCRECGVETEVSVGVEALLETQQTMQAVLEAINEADSSWDDSDPFTRKRVAHGCLHSFCIQNGVGLALSMSFVDIAALLMLSLRG